MINEIKEILNIFFEKLEIGIDSIDVSKIENKEIFKIKIKSNESDIIIWKDWKNIDSIYSILKIMISNRLWEKTLIQIEVNDYKKTKNDRLFDFIKLKIEEIQKDWKDICLPQYSWYERKKIHSFVSQFKNNWISTKSIWEWKERRIYICKKSPKLSIDIDWNDI